MIDERREVESAAVGQDAEITLEFASHILFDELMEEKVVQLGISV